ncbi:MAG: hypothetical protein QS98_C0006G0034 [archaeon GW2011_AR3]|nr:MAG: hypothetical protein QS98_C0006G0034 [archaeon GW2011_AR3]MBS3109204.1 hypothetical protein [Candidatus Woesearchaeota archaeon]
MNKKGDISITTIIVAAIALLVLIVLIAIFTGRISLFGKTYDTETTAAQRSICGVGGGRCVKGDCPFPLTQDSSRADWIDCATGTEICCRPGS